MKVEKFRDAIKFLLPETITLIVLVFVLSAIPKNPDIDDLRYALSAVAQSLAAIFAIVISLTLLVLRETSNRYSTKFVDLFLSPKYSMVFWFFILCSLISIIINIMALVNLTESSYPNSLNIAGSILKISLFSLLLLVFYIHMCLSILKPEELMKWIINKKDIKEVSRYAKTGQEEDPLLDCKSLIERLISLDEKESFSECLDIFVNFFGRIIYSKNIDESSKEPTMFYLIDYLHFLTSKVMDKNKTYLISIIRLFSGITNLSIKENLQDSAMISIESTDTILDLSDSLGKNDLVIERFNELKNDYFGKVKFDIFDIVSFTILAISDNVREYMSSKKIAEKFCSSNDEMIFWDHGGMILKNLSEKISSYCEKAIRENREFILEENINKLIVIGNFLVEDFSLILNYTKISNNSNPIYPITEGIEKSILKAKTHHHFSTFNQSLTHLFFPLLYAMAKSEGLLLEQFKEKYINICNHFIGNNEYNYMYNIINVWGNLLLQNGDFSNEKIKIICEGLKEIAIKCFRNIRSIYAQDWKFDIGLCIRFLIFAGIKFYDSKLKKDIINCIWEIDSKSRHAISHDFVLNIFKEITEEKYLPIEKINKPQKDIEELVMEGPYEKLTEDEYKTFLRFKEDYFKKHKN